MLKRGLKTLAVMLLVLLVLELAVRVLGLAPAPRPEFEGVDYVESDDPLLRYENRPGGGRTYVYRDRVGAEPWTVVHNNNSLGLRGTREVQRRKPAGTLRIACLGDSMTYGHGVNDDETWPAGLERELGARASGARLEVLNFAVSAYEAEQEVRQLERDVLSFEPDLVLLCWYFNDPALRDGGLQGPAETPPWVVRTFANNSPGLMRTVREHSQLADLVVHSLYRIAHSAYYLRTRSALYEEDAPGWVRARAALRKARDLLAHARIPFVVVLYPTLFRDGERLASHAAYEKVRAFCEAGSIAVLDLQPVFEPLDVESMWVHEFNQHPNPAAHALVARTVAEQLLAPGFIGTVADG